MPLSPDIADSFTVISSASPALPGFGVAAIAVQLTAPQIIAWDAAFSGGELFASVTQGTWQAVLTTLGFVDGDSLWEELEIGFGIQNDVPEFVLIGREAVPVAQITNFDLGDTGVAADGFYTMEVNSSSFTYEATGGAETRAQVITALLALLPGTEPVTDAAGGDAEQIDVTSAQAGIPFTFTASAPVGESWTLTTTTANIGLTSDLALWEAERQDWYFVTELSRDPLINQSMVGPVAAHPRDIVFVSQVSLATDPAATTDVSPRSASFITTSQRTAVAYVPSGTDHDLAAQYFRLLPTDPGVYTWTNVELRPIDGDKYTELQTRALRGKDTDPGKYWYYEELATRSFGVSRNARMGDGTKFEFIRDRDYLNNQIIINVSNAIIDAPKIIYSDTGAAIITGVINSTGAAAANPAAPIILPNTFTVTTLTRADQIPADIAAGEWKGWRWSATLAGSIDSATIRGTLFIV